MTIEYASYLLRHHYGSRAYYSNGRILFSIPIKAFEWFISYGDKLPLQHALELMQYIEIELKTKHQEGGALNV